MDESALQDRLNLIEKRLFHVRSLLVVGYVFAGTWPLVENVAVITAWSAGTGLLVLALFLSMLGVYRRRQSTRS